MEEIDGQVTHRKNNGHDGPTGITINFIVNLDYN